MPIHQIHHFSSTATKENLFTSALLSLDCWFYLFCLATSILSNIGLHHPEPRHFAKAKVINRDNANIFKSFSFPTPGLLNCLQSPVWYRNNWKSSFEAVFHTVFTKVNVNLHGQSIFLLHIINTWSQVFSMLISRLSKLKNNVALYYLLSFFFSPLFCSHGHKIPTVLLGTNLSLVRSVCSNHKTTEETADSICLMFSGDSMSSMHAFSPPAAAVLLQLERQKWYQSHDTCYIYFSYLILAFLPCLKIFL